MPPDLPDPSRPLRIGTRGSPLALAQAREARDRLMAAHGLPEAAFELVAEFDPKASPAVAIVKHANPCGVALGTTLAWGRPCPVVARYGQL